MKPFKMKQFVVFQEHAAMKVGTDGTILGAYMAKRLSSESPVSVLDVGTGTGLIALMIAQMTPYTEIHAIELDELSAIEAEHNFSLSPFASRLQLIRGDFTDYETDLSYDVIVSNPPYYTDTHKNTCERETQAKHSTTLKPYDFFSHSKKLLAPKGYIALIIATTALNTFAEAASLQGFTISEIVYIRGRSNLEPKRVITLWQRNLPESVLLTYFTIEREQRHSYTPEYQDLLSPFLIIFP